MEKNYCFNCQCEITENNIGKKPTLDDILKTGVTFYNICEKKIKKGCRDRSCKMPRYKVILAMYQFGYTLMQISKIMGYKEHTAIIHAKKSLSNIMETEPIERKDYLLFFQQIKNLKNEITNC